MNAMQDTIAAHEVGFDIPATPGMREADIQTPCLILDLDALERNIKKMGDYAKAHGMRHRVTARCTSRSTWRSCSSASAARPASAARRCREAEVFARCGIKDILITNEVRDPDKIDRLAQIPKLGARTIVCIDDIANVAELSAAAQKHGTTLDASSRSIAAPAAAA